MAGSAINATQVAEAGRSGKDVRSDLKVIFEPRSSGGIEIELVSRVAPYFGDSIRADALEVMKQLGVQHARVRIEDEGALPFVIAGRIEAAVRRAGMGAAKKALPERIGQPPAATAKDKLRRSRLYLPGNEPKYFVNAVLYGADGVILDLEDSVHPGEKDTARLLVRNALRAVDFGACERMVRINQLPLGLEDLEEIVPELPALILIPKTERPEQVAEVDRKIREILARSPETKNHVIWLMPILESALGIENAFAIATASDRVCALTIGLEDYTAALGVIKTPGGSESLYARQRMVNAAKAAGVQAIDSVFGDVNDMEGLANWGRASYAMGCEGMGCIHPGQIPVIHEAFAPQPKEIEKALKIVAAFQDAKAKGLGVVALGSKMIDAPVVARAVKLVARAKSMGLIPESEEQK